VSRICIVTPGQIGANPRVVKEADALHATGHDVSVIATRMLDQIDCAMTRSIPWRLQRIDLRSPLRWKLLRAGQLCTRYAYLATGQARRADGAYRAYARPLRRAAVETPADLYVAHYPDALPAVAAAAQRYQARYAYDAEDFHLGEWPDDAAYDIERQLVREIEGSYLPGCAYVTAASPAIADAYAEAYGIERPLVVLNAFPLDRACPWPTLSGTARPGPSVYWFSQTIGAHRGLECAVRALGLARTRPHLYLRGTPAAGYMEQLLQLAESSGAAGRLHLFPRDAPDKMEELAAGYDVGLCGESAFTRSKAVALTNKLFTYLLAGIAPLLSDTPGHRRFAEETGMTDLVFAREDPGALAQLLDSLLGDATRLAASRARAWRLGQGRYNWEREKGPLVEAAARATRRPGTIEAIPGPQTPDLEAPRSTRGTRRRPFWIDFGTCGTNRAS
jgi:glycosyltransferase involved in cell wall biosynthesis